MKFFLKETTDRCVLKLFQGSKIFIKHVISQDQKLQRSATEIFERVLFWCSVLSNKKNTTYAQKQKVVF
ncbi:hypothetical protein B0A80_08915 [Flavobacterium tructae]|nr:hypothetical protein B0A80_08915 [Flavobacterium tructae]